MATKIDVFPVKVEFAPLYSSLRAVSLGVCPRLHGKTVCFDCAQQPCSSLRSLSPKRIPEPEKDPWNGSVASSRRVEGSAWQSSVLRLRSATLQQPMRAENRRGNPFNLLLSLLKFSNKIFEFCKNCIKVKRTVCRKCIW